MTNVNLIKIYSAGNHYQFISTRKDNYFNFWGGGVFKNAKLPTIEQDGEYLECNMELNDVFNFFLQIFFLPCQRNETIIKVYLTD